MALYQLIYMSSMVSDRPELMGPIVASAVRNNSACGITGMMLHAGGNILQVLEGEEAAVRRTFEAIERDRRHGGVLELIAQHIGSRDFATWSMGFREISMADLRKFPAALAVLKADVETIERLARNGEALTLLKSFADGSLDVV